MNTLPTDDKTRGRENVRMKVGDRLIQELSHCTFGIGTASKRFVRDTASRPADAELSERAEAFAWRIAFHYRRQLSRDLADEAVLRRVPHQVVPAKDTWYEADCAVCLQHLLKRDLNAPCPGPPKPKPERKAKRERTPTVNITAASAPSLFDGERKDGEE